MPWIREAEERLHWANVINIMSINPKADASRQLTSHNCHHLRRVRPHPHARGSHRHRRSPRRSRSAASERWRTEMFLNVTPPIDPDLASHVMHDYRNADLDPQTRAIL